MDRYTAMLQYTGKEMANMLSVGHYIVSEKLNSEKNEKLVNGKLRAHPGLQASLKHWIYGIYLITDVIEYSHRDDTIIGVDFTREYAEIPESIPWGRDGNRQLPLRKLWKRKYITYFNMKEIKYRFFMGGPCSQETALGFAFLED